MKEEERALELRETLLRLQHSYYVEGRSEVSDTEYDRLFDELSALERDFPSLRTDDSPTQRVGSDLTSDFPEFKHTIPVLSLDKAYSDEAVLSWISKTTEAAGDELSFVLEEKIDGFSIVLYYEQGVLRRAVTRGNGSVGNDVTANARTIRNIPLRLTEDIDIAVRGEIYLPKDSFEAINDTLDEPYANPRNLAAGTIRRIHSSETARVPLSIFVYEGFWPSNTQRNHLEILAYLKHLGFTVDPHLSCFAKTREAAAGMLARAGLSGTAGSFDEIGADIVARTSGRQALGYEIDGLVLKVNEIVYRDVLGYTEHHPRWAIAYKFESPQATSVVENIDVQVGRTGRITPMARIRATELAGSTIRNITLHNQDYVNGLELAVGDTVAISKRGDVIPAVESVLEKNDRGNTTWSMPSVCPVCGSPVEQRGAHHFCSNYSCPEQVVRRIEFFCAKKQMDIEGLGPSTVRELFDKGYVTCISDLYRFCFRDMVGERGYGLKTVETIEKGIAQSLKAPFENVIVALGIPELGKKAARLLIDAGYTTMDSLLALTDADLDKLSLISGIGPVTARLIVDGFSDPSNRRLIDELRRAGLSMEAVVEQSTLPQIFSGQSWCVSGTFEHFVPRDKAMAEIVSRGGREVSSVSSKTSCLLAGANCGSKLEKARALGVRIVSEDEFLSIISANVSFRHDMREEKGLFDDSGN